MNEIDFNKELGRRLRGQRVINKISQSKIGNLLGVSYQQVQKYESGANRIPAYYLKLWADATVTNINYFFKGIYCMKIVSYPIEINNESSEWIGRFPDFPSVEMRGGSKADIIAQSYDKLDELSRKYKDGGLRMPDASPPNKNKTISIMVEE